MGRLRSSALALILSREGSSLAASFGTDGFCGGDDSGGGVMGKGMVVISLSLSEQP